MRSFVSLSRPTSRWLATFDDVRVVRVPVSDVGAEWYVMPSQYEAMRTVLQDVTDPEQFDLSGFLVAHSTIVSQLDQSRVL